MIRHSKLTSLLRFYDCEQSDDPFLPYVAVCNIIWESADTVWVQGMHGKLTRKLLREFLKFCVDNDIKKVKAFRAPNHLLPLMVEIEDHYEILVKDLVDRFGVK